MRLLALAGLILTLTTGLVTGLVWQEPAPSPAEIARWITDLADSDFETREKAGERLWKTGLAAEAALKKAAKSDDVEVKRRVEEILGRFRLGIYPDSPKQIVDLAAEYQSADPSNRQPVLTKLLALGAPGARALTRLVAEEPEGLRQAMVEQLNQILPGSVARLLDGKPENAKALEDLVLLVARQSPRGPALLCAWSISTGQGKNWGEALQKGTAPFEGWDEARRKELHVWLLRSGSQLDEAIVLAREGAKGLLPSLLMEKGAWAELARNSSAVVEGTQADPAEKIAERATYARLAGDKKGFEDSVKTLLELAGRDNDGERMPYPARVLFLNDRPTEAVDALTRADARQAAFEILATQMRMKEAFALVAEARKDNRHDEAQLELLEAKTLYLLGEKKKGAALFDKYAAQIAGGVEPVWYELLIEQQVLGGRTDEACAHAALIFRQGSIDGWRTRLFMRLYGENQANAEIWWHHLRIASEGAPYEAHLKTIMGLLNGRLPEEDLVAELKSVKKALEKNPGHDGLRLAAAEAAHRGGLDTWEATLLEGGKRAEVYIRLGDLHALGNRLPQALEAYAQACRIEPANALAWHLQGRLLVSLGKGQATQETEGKKLQDLALKIPLGDVQARSTLMTALLKRGHVEDAARQGALLLAVSDPGTFQSGNAYRLLAQDAERRDAFLEAARYQELGLLRCLSRQVSFMFPSAYVAVPAQVHRLKARGLLARGDIDGARREMVACQALMPRDVELPILLYDELVKRGRKTDAESLYQESLSAHEALLQDHPDCAWARNSAAWMIACCKRDLDSGLNHATRATQLSPQSPGYWDTLGEICFQKGDQAGAIQAQEKAIRLDPHRVYYRRQMLRFRTGDKNTPRPPETFDE